MTITEFLLARIAEDEAEARRAGEMRERVFGNVGVQESDTGFHAYDDLGCPALVVGVERGLAECKAKRRAIEAAWGDHEQIESEWGSGQSQEAMDAKNDVPEVIRALASVYADHPNYDPAWA